MRHIMYDSSSPYPVTWKEFYFSFVRVDIYLCPLLRLDLDKAKNWSSYLVIIKVHAKDQEDVDVYSARQSSLKSHQGETKGLSYHAVAGFVQVQVYVIHTSIGIFRSSIVHSLAGES